MERLSLTDQRAVLGALRELYAQTDLDELRVLMLRLAGRLVASEWTSFNEIARDDFRSVMNIRLPDTPEIQRHAPGLFACIHEHPAANMTRAGSATAHAMADFYSWPEFQRTTMYNDYYRLVGVRHQVFFNIDGGHGPHRSIAINRKNCGFSERDRTVLDLINPHFGQAYANAVHVDRIRADAAARSPHDAAPTEITLLLTAGLRFEPIAGPARRWLETHLGDEIREGRSPPDSMLRWLKNDAHNRNDSSFLNPPSAPLIMPGSNGAVTAHVVCKDTGGRTLLVLKCARPPAAAAPDFPDLTPRENEILDWIVRGKSNPEIATILGLSVRTVYKHVENLFAKLGVETRAQAMVRALDARR